MCVARKIQSKKSKIGNQGELCIFLGYPSSHTSDTYRLLTSSTQKVVVLHDVIFLGKTYGKWTDENTKELKTQLTEDDELFLSDGIGIQFEFEEDDEDVGPKLVTDDEDEDDDVTEVEEEDKSKVVRVLKQLDSSFNPLATKYLT